MVDKARPSRLRKPRKNVVMFVLSLVLGGVGVFYSKHYIEQQIAYYKGQLDKTETMVEVVVPKRKLQRGEVLRASDLVMREIPAKYADSNSVTGSNYETAVGQRVDFDVDEGRPLLWAHLEGGLTPTFSGAQRSGCPAHDLWGRRSTTYLSIDSATRRHRNRLANSGRQEQWRCGAKVQYDNCTGNSRSCSENHTGSTSWKTDCHAEKS